MRFLHKNIGRLLVAIALLVGLRSFDDYGISWDEERQHDIGDVSYNYVFNDDNTLLNFKDRDYGVAFELPLILIERFFNLTDSREIYLSRHLATHAFYLLAAYCCFVLIDTLYNNKLLATVGFLLMVLSPRIYAHSFFNTKDLPFLSMFLICLMLGGMSFSRCKIGLFLLLGIATGLLCNMRLMGVLFFGCVSVFLLIDLLASKERRQHLVLLATYVVSSATSLYASWPFLWANPFRNFTLAFENMANFRWKFSSLFFGKFVSAENMGWEYSLVWFGITTPIVYLVAGLFGMVLLIVAVFRDPKLYLSNTGERNNLIYLICCTVPFLAVILMNSVLYDGWRQLYFVYPSFVLLIIYGLDSLSGRKKLQYVVLSFFGISFCSVFHFMIANAPHQQVYFNRFVDTSTPEQLRQQFEMDYWGVSYRQAFEYILGHDDSKTINVSVARFPGKANLRILPVEDRNRIRLSLPNDAKFFITTYRWHPQDYDDLEGLEWYSLKVLNNSIVTIFKLR